EAAVLAGTLIRRLEGSRFDPDHVPGNVALKVKAAGDGAAVLTVAARDLPSALPPGWRLCEIADRIATLEITDRGAFWIETARRLAVQSAGQLPSGFEPAALYNSRFHPRGLQLAIVAASDAVRASGIPWQTIIDRVHADEIAVYAA